MSKPSTRMSVLLAVLAAPSAATAEGWHLTAELLTDVPIQVGAKVVAEAPQRVRLSTSVGVMPSAYVDLINSTAESFEWYGESTAKLIEIMLQNTVVWRTHVGWRPFPERGFYFEAGYGLGVATGSTVGQADLAEASGAESPMTRGGESLDFESGAVLHMADVEVGWQWNLWEDLWLRAALGGAFTLGSSVTIERTFESSAPAWDTFETASEDYLIETLDTYAHTVVGTLAVGYRFF